MSAPHVVLRLEDGRTTELRPGAIIGRLPGAGLRLNDPRVSEAHALLSLRGRELRLLALRGLISAGRGPAPSIALRPGMRVLLAPDLGLEVLDVVLPDAVLALTGPWPGAVELTGAVYALRADGTLEPRVVPGAVAHLWSDGERWVAQEPGGAVQALEAGRSLELGGYNISVVLVPLEQTLVEETADYGRFNTAISLICSFDSARIELPERPPLLLAGNPARILNELVAFGGPVEWELVAQQIWREEPDRVVLRQNWDRNLSALRSRLKAAGVRPDLVRSDGKGKVELVLLPQDRVEDRG